MWALRRAANLTRAHSCRVSFYQGCYAKLDIVTDSLEHGICYHVHGCLVTGSSRLPKLFSHELSSSSKSFSVTRSLSSHIGAKTSDSEVDLEDEFSELETPTGTDRVDNMAGEEDAHEFVTGPDLSDDTSEEDSVDVVATDFGLTDSAAVSKGEKASRKSPSAQLFDVIVASPHHSISRAMEKWIEEGNTLGRAEIALAMLILQKHHFFWRALQLSEWVEANKHLDFVERDYSSRLDLIAKVHGFLKAERYIEKIPASFRGEIIYRTLLANCVSATNVKKSEEVFNKIRDLGLPLTTFACNQLLLLYKRVIPKKMADVLLMMEKENVKPSLFTYKLLIHTKGCSNDINGMELVLETMKAQGMEPDILIQAMVARYYINAGVSEKAEATLKKMEGDDIKENRSSCKVLLPLYASLGKADDVGRLWKVCETNPYVDECLAAIEAWGKLGRIEDAEAVFEKMLTKGKRLSSKCYNALLKVYANHKLFSKGKDLAKRMADNGCYIGSVTWNALVSLYVGAGEVEKADSVLHKAFQQNHIRPLFNSYIAVMTKYSERGDIHNTEKLFNRLRQNGYTGRMTQYRLLLEAYINAKTPAYGFRERMKADNIFPNRTMAEQLANVDAFRKTQISELLD